MRRSDLSRWLLVAAALSAFTPAMARQSQFAWLREGFLSHYQTANVSDMPGLIGHDIDDFGNCSFFAKRGVRWHQDFEDGSRLELRCDPDHGSLLPGFHLWYLGSGKAPFEIGRCVFDAGFNRGWYYTSSDPSIKGPVSVEWVNVDGGKNDGGGRHLDRDHVTGPEEPYVDVVDWSFDPRQRRLECTSDKYRYTSSSLRLPDRPEPLEQYVGDLVPELRRSFVTFAR